MNNRVKQLFDQAQQLSPEEQAQLLDLMLVAAAETSPDWEKAWADEAERRWQAYKGGESKSYSWEEVKAQLGKV
jgi:putative addiction module component (TIGR02574 family)